MDVPGWEVFGILLCVGLSSLFSGGETAITSLGAARIRKLLEKGPRLLLLRMWERRSNLVLTTLLIGNNLVNITASALATDVSHQVLRNYGVEGEGYGLSLAIGLMTLIILIFGEVIPKSYAKAKAEKFVVVVFRLLSPFYYLFYPGTLALGKLTRWVVKLFGEDLTPEKPKVTPEDIEFMISVGSEDGGIEDETQKLLSSVIDFHDTLAKTVMVPRTEILAFSVETPIAEVLAEIKSNMYSRYPVYEENIDDVIGMFYAKEVFQAIEASHTVNFSLRGHLREPYFVPETKRIGDLLREFQQRKIHMAIVVDEFGGTAGIVTLEDIIEEIVGEIYDEWDVDEEQPFKQIGDNRYIVDAKIPIKVLEDLLSVKFPENSDYDTLAGFIMSNTGKVPEKDSQLVWNGISFTVKDSDPRSISKIEIFQAASPGEQ